MNTTSHWKRMQTSVSALVLLLWFPLTGWGAGWAIVGEGEAPVTVWVDAGLPEDSWEVAGASELVRVLSLMSPGRTIVLEKVSDASEVKAGPGNLVVGSLAEGLGLKMELESRARDGYRYAVLGDRLLIVGESDRGAYHGVFALLESLGAGWYVPGPIGEVIPERETVIVENDLDVSEVSDSLNRRFWYGGGGSGRESRQATDAWSRRLGGLNNVSSWNHAWRGMVQPRDHFESNPELFSYSIARGERTTRQLCTTNPETIRIASETLLERMRNNPDQIVFAAGPNDGGGLCECPDCLALDDPSYLEPSRGFVNASDRIFKFANDLAEITTQEFPDKKLGVLVYSDYSRVPLTLEKLHPNVVPMIAPIRRCRLHGPGHPGCHWSALLAEEIEGWAKISPSIAFYMYNYNLADTLLPLGKIEYYRLMQEHIQKNNLTELDWIHESMDSWAAHAPSHYLSVRLTWRSDIDIDETMDRFFDQFYGAAAEPMKRYWLRVDQAYTESPTHTGASYGQTQIWTPEMLAASRRDIEEAKQLASNEREREAVEMASAGLRCAELFIGIRQATNNHDFRRAYALQEQLRLFVDEMAEASAAPNWAHQRYSYQAYYRRFIGLTVIGGYEALQGGGEVVVRFPDEWKFIVDEAEEGAELGFANPDFDDSAWDTLHTYTKSWDDQGLGWYHGQGWYRTEFELSEDQIHGDLRLWFGGFDEMVDATLNGVNLGELTGFARPLEYEDIRQHLRPGRNVLAVRTTNYGLAEIGTGGIMMPVMIYRKGDGPAEETPTIEVDDIIYEM